MSGAKISKDRAYQDRRCVAMDLAFVDTKGVLRYHWGAIERAWTLWHDANLTAFCEHFELNYQTVHNRTAFSSGAKKLLLQQVNARYRQVVVHNAVVKALSQTGQEDTVGLGDTITAIRETVAVLSRYARARMVKVAPGGAVLPNTAVTPRDAKAVADIVASCASTMRNLFELRELLAAAAQGPEAKRRFVPVPAPLALPGPGARLPPLLPVPPEIRDAADRVPDPRAYPAQEPRDDER